MLEKFVKTIELAAKYREESWTTRMVGRTNESKYEKTIGESIEDAIKETGINVEFSVPIFLLLSTSWNESLECVNNYYKELGEKNDN